MNKSIFRIFSLALLLAASTLEPCAALEKAGESPGLKGGDGKDTSEKGADEEEKKPPSKPPKKTEAKKLKSDPVAEKAFQKAVAWQGKPQRDGKVMSRIGDFLVEELRFKAFGKNEIEGQFKLFHTAPDKIRFKVSTPTWWRRYMTDGESYWWKTGASRGWEKLTPGKADHEEKTEVIKQALRIVRLIFLQNFNDGKSVFRYLGRQTLMKGEKDLGPAHLVKCQRPGEDTILFYLGIRGGMPKCIVVHRFMHLEHPNRDFFIFLEDFKMIDGVRLPGKIKMYIRHLSVAKDEKFLFCELVHDNAAKVKINSGISVRRTYSPGK
jgi:hypothetical protein